MGIWPGSLQYFFVFYSKRHISGGRTSKDNDQGKLSASVENPKRFALLSIMSWLMVGCYLRC